jgi:hypothetical protein
MRKWVIEQTCASGYREKKLLAEVISQLRAGVSAASKFDWMIGNVFTGTINPLIYYIGRGNPITIWRCSLQHGQHHAPKPGR